MGYDQHAREGGGYKKHVKKNLKKTYSTSTIEVSDGVGTATAIIQKDICDELILNDQQITMHCIMVVKGDIFRQRCDDGKTGFIFNEAPRLIINEVEGIIGDPIPLVKACQQAKYDDMQAKYAEDYFKIPYVQHFFNRYIARISPLVSNREH